MANENMIEETWPQRMARLHPEKPVEFFQAIHEKYPNHHADTGINVTGSRDPADNLRGDMSARRLGFRRIKGPRGIALIPNSVDPKDAEAVAAWERASLEMHENQPRLEALEAKQDERPMMRRPFNRGGPTRREITTPSVVKVGRNTPEDYAPGVVRVEDSASVRKARGDDLTAKKPTPAISTRELKRS